MKLKHFLRAVTIFCFSFSLFLAGVIYQQHWPVGPSTPSPVTIQTETKQATEEVAPEETVPTPEAPRPEEPDSIKPKKDPSWPEWARVAQLRGDVLLTKKVGGLTVKIRQLPAVKAVNAGYLIHPNTNEPLVKAGDELAMISIEVANTGKKPVVLPRSLVAVTARYAKEKAWPWVNPMSGDYTDSIYTKQGIHYAAVESDFDGERWLTLGVGQRYAYGETYPAKWGEKILFAFSYRPKDADKKISANAVLKEWLR